MYAPGEFTGYFYKNKFAPQVEVHNPRALKDSTNKSGSPGGRGVASPGGKKSAAEKSMTPVSDAKKNRLPGIPNLKRIADGGNNPVTSTSSQVKRSPSPGSPTGKRSKSPQKDVIQVVKPEKDPKWPPRVEPNLILPKRFISIKDKILGRKENIVRRYPNLFEDKYEQIPEENIFVTEPKKPVPVLSKIIPEPKPEPDPLDKSAIHTPFSNAIFSKNETPTPFPMSFMGSRPQERLTFQEKKLDPSIPTKDLSVHFKPWDDPTPEEMELIEEQENRELDRYAEDPFTHLQFSDPNLQGNHSKLAHDSIGKQSLDIYIQKINGKFKEVELINKEEEELRDRIDPFAVTYLAKGRPIAFVPNIGVDRVPITERNAQRKIKYPKGAEVNAQLMAEIANLGQFTEEDVLKAQKGEMTVLRKHQDIIEEQELRKYIERRKERERKEFMSLNRPLALALGLIIPPKQKRQEVRILLEGETTTDKLFSHWYDYNYQGTEKISAYGVLLKKGRPKAYQPYHRDIPRPTSEIKVGYPVLNPVVGTLPEPPNPRITRFGGFIQKGRPKAYEPPLSFVPRIDADEMERLKKVEAQLKKGRPKAFAPSLFKMMLQLRNIQTKYARVESLPNDDVPFDCWVDPAPRIRFRKGKPVAFVPPLKFVPLLGKKAEVDFTPELYTFIDFAIIEQMEELIEEVKEKEQKKIPLNIEPGTNPEVEEFFKFGIKKNGRVLGYNKSTDTYYENIPMFLSKLLPAQLDPRGNKIVDGEVEVIPQKRVYVLEKGRPVAFEPPLEFKEDVDQLTMQKFRTHVYKTDAERGRVLVRPPIEPLRKGRPAAFEPQLSFLKPPPEKLTFSQLRLNKMKYKRPIAFEPPLSFLNIDKDDVGFQANNEESELTSRANRFSKVRKGRLKKKRPEAFEPALRFVFGRIPSPEEENQLEAKRPNRILQSQSLNSHLQTGNIQPKEGILDPSLIENTEQPHNYIRSSDRGRPVAFDPPFNILPKYNSKYNRELALARPKLFDDTVMWIVNGKLVDLSGYMDVLKVEPEFDFYEVYQEVTYYVNPAMDPLKLMPKLNNDISLAVITPLEGLTKDPELFLLGKMLPFFTAEKIMALTRLVTGEPPVIIIDPAKSKVGYGWGEFGPDPMPIRKEITRGRPISFDVPAPGLNLIKTQKVVNIQGLPRMCSLVEKFAEEDRLREKMADDATFRENIMRFGVRKLADDERKVFSAEAESSLNQNYTELKRKVLQISNQRPAELSKLEPKPVVTPPKVPPKKEKKPDKSKPEPPVREIIPPPQPKYIPPPPEPRDPKDPYYHPQKPHSRPGDSYDKLAAQLTRLAVGNQPTTLQAEPSRLPELYRVPKPPPFTRGRPEAFVPPLTFTYFELPYRISTRPVAFELPFNRKIKVSRMEEVVKTVEVKSGGGGLFSGLFGRKEEKAKTETVKVVENVTREVVVLPPSGLKYEHPDILIPKDETVPYYCDDMQDDLILCSTPPETRENLTTPTILEYLDGSLPKLSELPPKNFDFTLEPIRMEYTKSDEWVFHIYKTPGFDLMYSTDYFTYGISTNELNPKKTQMKLTSEYSKFHILLFLLSTDFPNL